MSVTVLLPSASLPRSVAAVSKQSAERPEGGSTTPQDTRGKRGNDEILESRSHFADGVLDDIEDFVDLLFGGD